MICKQVASGGRSRLGPERVSRAALLCDCSESFIRHPNGVCLGIRPIDGLKCSGGVFIVGRLVFVEAGKSGGFVRDGSRLVAG